MEIPTNKDEKWAKIYLKDENNQIITSNYWISTQGRVWNETRQKMLSLTPNRENGYYKVRLRHEKKYYNRFVHRLVAQAFIPNPNNYPIINHKDENKLNNNVENLEWCTFTYNRTYGTCISKQAHAISETTSSLYIMCHPYTGAIIDLGTMKYCSEKYGIKKNSIENVILGKACTAGGYSWIRTTKQRREEFQIGQILPKSIQPIPSTHIIKEKKYLIKNVATEETIQCCKTLQECGNYFHMTRENIRQKILYHSIINGHYIIEKKETITILPPKLKQPIQE